MKNQSRIYTGILLFNIITFMVGCGSVNEPTETVVSNASIDGSFLTPGGIPVGIYMDTDGVMVIDTAEISSPSGSLYNPGAGIVLSGDYIVALNNKPIMSKNTLIDEVKELSGDPITLSIRREDEYFDFELTPALDENGQYKLGIWVRDNLQGLGTLTYVDQDNNFGALGHGIHDIDTSELMEITGGELYKASISGIIPGEVGSPGGLEGMIIYNNYNKMGVININDESGIYGRVNDIESLGVTLDPLPVASIEEMEKGAAIIYCTIDDEVECYDIEIVRVNKYEKEVNKGLVIEITDEELIAKTGGIVQGMSGSPIIQNGKIIGAVTHVMVNDPTKGYGIFIENMMEMSEGIN